MKRIYLYEELAKRILKGGTDVISLDLGLSYREYNLDKLREIVGDELLKKVKGNPVYVFEEGKLKRLSTFTDHYYSFSYIENQPVLEIDGVRMHIFSFSGDVFGYAKNVVKLLNIKRNMKVLETCFGFGYITKELLKKNSIVYAIEKNREVVELAKYNPYVQDIFEDKRLNLIIGDAYEVVESIDEKFDRIVHDPPRFSFAPLLYSQKFYVKLWERAKKGAFFYHYVGAIGKHRGRNFYRGVWKRLQQAGWKPLFFDRNMMAIVSLKQQH